MSCPHVIGVDVALAHLAFAFAPVDGGPITVETLVTRADATQGERLGLLDRQVRAYAAQVADRQAEVAWVEQPSGRFRAPALLYATGVVQAALFEVLRCPVWTVPSGTWKKRTVGVGNATKQQVAAWVAAQGADVASQDEADAYAIAAAGRAMVLARDWGAAA